MKRTLFVLSMAVAACKSVDDRPACDASADCAAGQYCAHTADGNVCWADSVAPTVSAVTVTCDDTPCRRDGVLHVVAEVTDDHEVLDATVSLDLAAAPTVPMTRSGSSWVADVQLREYPFDAYARTVTANVTARDGARNEGAPLAADPVGVTRMRWTYDAAVPMTSAAVMANGTAVVGLSNNSEQLLAIAADGTKAWGLNVGATAFVTAAPAIGERAIWVGSEDFSLYGVNLDGSGLLGGVGVNTDGAVRGSVAVLPETTKEWGFVTSASGRVSAASTIANEYDKTGTGDAFAVGPVIRTDAKVCGATCAASATVRCYAFDGAFTVEGWTASVGVNVSAPLAVDAGDNIWTVSQDAKLYRTTVAGSATEVAALVGSAVDSPVILPDGNVVVGDATGTLRRYTSTGTLVWSRKLNGDAMTNEALLAPLVLSGGSASLVVPTKTGVLYALDGSANEVWRTTLASAAELRAGNIYTPPGQPPGTVLSTAYFSATNGKLYAVIVDGELDASAPWPKAFHDPRNTNRAGPQP
jgi:hypothetical protein